MVGIRNQSSVRIFKSGLCFLERNAVLSTVAIRLVRIPFETHSLCHDNMLTR